MAIRQHGVIGLTKKAAAEFGKQGIRINAICPGLVDTPMSAQAMSQLPTGHRENFINAAIPLGFEGKPENIAQPIVWLCSEGARYITGTTLVADGGTVCTIKKA